MVKDFIHPSNELYSQLTRKHINYSHAKKILHQKRNPPISFWYATRDIVLERWEGKGKKYLITLDKYYVDPMRHCFQRWEKERERAKKCVAYAVIEGFIESWFDTAAFFRSVYITYNYSSSNEVKRYFLRVTAADGNDKNSGDGGGRRKIVMFADKKSKMFFCALNYVNWWWIFFSTPPAACISSLFLFSCSTAEAEQKNNWKLRKSFERNLLLQVRLTFFCVNTNFLFAPRGRCYHPEFSSEHQQRVFI